jgi:hypothetical protein
MTTFIIIIGLILIFIIYFFLSNKIRVRKHNDRIKEIYLAHEKLKYPELDKKTQLEIMVTGDSRPISELTPVHKGVPYDLLKKYITISKNELKEYIILSGFIEKQKLENAPNPKHDGIWLLKNKIIDQERGVIQRTWKTKNEKEVIEIYTDLLWNRVFG